MSEITVDLVREPDPHHVEWLLRLRATTATDVAEGRPLDMILADLAEAAADRIDGSAIVVLTLDGDTPHVRASNAPAAITRVIHGVRRRAWFGSWSAAITRRTDVVVPELTESSLYREHRPTFVQHGLLAARAAPLMGRHHLVAGAITLYLTEPRLLDDHELDVIELVTELAGLALRRDESTRELLDRIRHDPLTGLENRDGLEDHIRSALINTSADGPAVGLLFVDIDDLTLINDSLGHTIGDSVIATTASRIRAQLMRADTVVRFGGDEFIVVLDQIHSLTDARSVAERIRRAIGQPIDVADTTVNVTVSIGITLGRTGTPPLQLIDEGHAAVVRAKQSGRGSTTEHDRALDTGAGDRLDREQQLRQALDDGEFTIYWQPKIDLGTGLIVGAEALVRWRHRELGIVGPDHFISTAERAGMIDELSDWVLCQAIEDAVGLTAVTEGFSAAINLSATQLARPEIEDVIASALDTHGLPPKNLIVELTESTLANDIVVRRLHALRAAGLQLAIDDFGTGYSSLAYVQQLPVDIVKVDRAFLDGLRADGTGAPILSAAVAMAHALDMTATVEGVESDEQLAGLRALDVDWGQGYLFAEPAPQATLIRQIEEGPRF